MKFLYLISLIVTICKTQKNLTFCDDYIEYNITYYGKLISHLKLSNYTDIILATDRLMILDDELNVLSSLPIPKSNGSKCEWIFNQSPGLIFVGCQKSGEAPYLIAYKSVNVTHLTQFGDIVYFPLNETVNDIKGTLNTLFTIQRIKVTFFKLVMTLTDWTIQTTSTVLDKEYFATTATIQIMDLAFEPYLQDNLQCYKLILVEYYSGAYWVDTIVKNNILSPFRFGQISMTTSCKYLKSTFHSTTQTQSLLTFITSSTCYIPYVKATYNQTSTSVSVLLQFDSSSLPASSTLKQAGNIQGIMYKGSQKDSTLWLYNVILPKTQNEIQSLYANPQNKIVKLQTNPQNKIESLQAYPYIDSLTSPPQDYAIFYFSSDFRVVHSIEDNKLQSCDLYNYKIQMQ